MEFMDLIETPRVDNIRYCRQIYNEEQGQVSTQFVDGSLCLTSHHLIFSSKNTKQEIWIMHSLIDSLESKIRDNNTKFQLILKCKDFRVFIIEFPVLNQLQSVVKSLDALSNITSESMKLPFFNTNTVKTCEEDGWNLYSIAKEFQLYFDNKETSDWRITDLNSNYSICSTYATKLIVPKSIDDPTLIKSSQFRSMGRFPVLSYYHKLTKSFLLRCGQPLLGSSKKRSKEDENLLKTALPIGKKGYIYDLRDVNVMKNAAKSNTGGYETEQSYPLWTKLNRHLDRYDQLQTSFCKLVETCSSDTNSWLSKIDSSGWYSNARQALYIACCIADELHNKNGCVIVHGPDGTDNTLLVTSLVKILLNPEYRTLKGFEMLIESEWINAGHPFSKRCAKSAYGSTSQRQEGPVFLLFLDCVRQLLDQFCVSFEFNEEFLVSLFDNAYSSQYGTFIGNCERERDTLFVKTRTTSLWSHVNAVDNVNNYLNPIYEKKTSALWPSLYFQSLNVWSKLFLRYQRNEAPFVEQRNEILRLVQEDLNARLKVEKLRSELIELQNEAIAKGIFVTPNDN